MPLTRQTAYDQLAATLRGGILAGDYEPTADNPTRNQLPGASELGTTFGVSDKTAARAVQQLIAEGLVRSRPGQRAIVLPRTQRPDLWPMNRRYARARAAGGLVFGGDMQGREVSKRITLTGDTPAPPSVAALLGINTGDTVWARGREMLIDERLAEISISYFPSDVAERAALTTSEPFPPGGVVRILEDAGYLVTRTYNEVRSRLATRDELQAFGPDSALLPLNSRVVIEVTHATYGDHDQPLEAVISVRPAENNVITFETHEGDPTPPLPQATARPRSSRKGPRP